MTLILKLKGSASLGIYAWMVKLILVKNGRSGQSKSYTLFHGITNVVPFSFCKPNKLFIVMPQPIFNSNSGNVY